MKRILTAILIVFICNVLTAQAQTNRVIWDEVKKENILYGKCDFKEYFDEEFKVWFDEEYNQYIPNVNVFDGITYTPFDSIYVFFSTWCSDSRREVPRFVKFLDEYPNCISFDYSRVKYFALDSQKHTDIINTKQFDINFVPTFIFYSKGNEIGRIIEEPTNEFLEKDVKEFLLEQ